MKTLTKVVLFVAALISSQSLTSQNSINKGPSKPPTAADRELIIKNGSRNDVVNNNKVPEGTTIAGNGDNSKLNFNTYPCDVRANKYYSTADLAKMSVLEKKKLNYYFAETFEIPTGQPSGCPALIKSEINVMDYLYSRKQSERVELIINEKCNQKIILHSLDEIEIANQKIKE